MVGSLTRENPAVGGVQTQKCYLGCHRPYPRSPRASNYLRQLRDGLAGAMKYGSR